jgi:hypothetical protein
MFDERRLAPHCSTRTLDSPHRFLRHIRLQLTWVAVVTHDRYVLTGATYLLEQTPQIICVIVGDKPIRPIRKRFRSDANAGDVLQ